MVSVYLEHMTRGSIEEVEFSLKVEGAANSCISSSVGILFVPSKAPVTPDQNNSPLSVIVLNTDIFACWAVLKENVSYDLPPFLLRSGCYKNKQSCP